MDEDDKDESKRNRYFRKMRNLSEKKRRDQFNILINELCAMVSHNNRKMDKSMVLKSTIAFLRHHNDSATRSKAQGPQEDWQPPFMTDEEFIHLMLEALDGFILVFSTCGKILYVSESVASLLGHLPNTVLEMTIYDLLHEESRSEVYRILTFHEKMVSLESSFENTVSFSCHIKRRVENMMEPVAYELVKFTGSYKNWRNRDDKATDVTSGYSNFKPDEKPVFVAVAKLQTPQLLREIALLYDATKSEFTSRHSLEWKFLFLDNRAPPIIGYLPFEVLGTSGYDYYHADDLDRVAACHEALMQTGEGKSCYFRFLTKGQQWIWLQTQYYITYHQWNSKPEFIVCNHTVASYDEVRTHLRKEYRYNLRVTQSSGLTSSNDSILKKTQALISPHSTKVTSAMSKLEHVSGLKCSPDSETTDGQMNDHPLHSTSNNLQDAGHLPISSHSQSESNFDRPRIEPQVMPTTLQYGTSYQPEVTLGRTSLEHNASETTTVSVMVSPTQNPFQEQLRRKQQALQEQIHRQQEELRRVQEQLLLSHCGSSTKVNERRLLSKSNCNTGKNFPPDVADSFFHPISSGVTTQPLPSVSANHNFDQQK